MKKTSKNLSVFFATFAPYENNRRLPTNGMVEGTLNFLVPRIKRFLIVIQPYPGSDRIDPIIEKYENGKIKSESTFSKWFYLPIYLICLFQKKDKTYIVYKLRDLISVFLIGVRDIDSYDLFIGLESIHTIAGIWLRKLGKVKKVIYRVSDYSPNRYSSKFFNFIYVALDRYCAANADYIWDVSPAMHPARIKAGLPPKKSAPNFVVPNALFKEQISSEPINNRIPYSLVYMGTLHYVNGPDLAIESMDIIRKKFPKAKLHIIGGGEDNMKRLKKLVEKLKLSEHVIFYGFIVDNIKMTDIVKKCYIAIAPYIDEEKSIRKYADATKIRQYLGSGLPIVTTHVPPLGKQIVEEGAGIAVLDTKKDFAQAIIKLLSNKKLYISMSKNSIRLGKDNTWDNVYRRAFEQIDINL